jgi:hypothetical protein
MKRWLSSSHLSHMEPKARLPPRWVGGRDGYLYSVLFHGELLIQKLLYPQCDAARPALLILSPGSQGGRASLCPIPSKATYQLLNQQAAHDH